MAYTVSVIVPVYNAASTIGSCLRSLVNQSHPKEIIVVDNGSTDKTASIVEEFPVRLFYEYRRNQFTARNTGVKKAKGEILAFTDSDCIADRDWIKNLVKPFKDDDKIGGVGGRTRSFEVKTVFQAYAHKKKLFHRDWKRGIIGTRAYFPLCNVAYRRDVFEDIDYFDERTFSGSDTDFSFRVSAAGYNLFYEPDAVIYHIHKPNMRSFLEQHYRYGGGEDFLRLKYNEQPSLLWMCKPYFVHLVALNIPRLGVAIVTRRGVSFNILDIISIVARIVGILSHYKHYSQVLTA